jgi:hypothetical protein
MVFGMNWAYMPIGENYSYDFWGKPDDFIKKALHSEMTLLRDMGVNAVRVYTGIPPRWIEYMYREYGIYTILNHAMGRYGHVIDGTWRRPDQLRRRADPGGSDRGDRAARPKDYQRHAGALDVAPREREQLRPLLGGPEIEDLPEEQQGDARATYLYSLMGEAIDAMHAVDEQPPRRDRERRPAVPRRHREEAPNLDIMGSNVYRGYSSGDLFERVSEVLGVPFVYTEFGSDAYNAGRSARTTSRRPSTCCRCGRRSTSTPTASAGPATPSVA